MADKNPLVLALNLNLEQHFLKHLMRLMLSFYVKVKVSVPIQKSLLFTVSKTLLESFP